MQNFEQLLSNLDLKLFEKINSQSTDDDKKSFLALQLAVREICPNYNYLEIGSHLGGSIQPHLIDEKCAKIYSIDKRPMQQADERGLDYVYKNNSTGRMLDELKKVAPENLGKLKTLDGDAAEINVSEIKEKMQVCFIDGEHTDHATNSDFDFCLKVLDENGLIVFHDAHVIYNGIADCIKKVENTGRKFRAYSLPQVVFVIEIGDFPVHQNEKILGFLTNNYRSYIGSLQNNDSYRRFANMLPFRTLKRIYAKALGRDVVSH